MRTSILIVLMALLLAGCDWTDMSPVDEQVVVESYLRANKALPLIRLTRSASVDDVYDPTTRAVTGASVVVELLGDSGSVQQAFAYRLSDAEPSVYLPEDHELVAPGGTYRLRVTLQDGALVTSTTTVPDTMAILSINRDSTEYEGDQFELTLTRSHYPGRDAYIVFSSEALDASEANATPFTRELLETDDGLAVDELRVTSSPPFGEATYLDEASDLLHIDVPWLAVRFYGRHVIRVSAIDDNLYDFLRSHLVQQGGSTFLPGEVPNILDHVEGGTGVFGSYADAAEVVFVQRGVQ